VILPRPQVWQDVELLPRRTQELLQATVLRAAEVILDATLALPLDRTASAPLRELAAAVAAQLAAVGPAAAAPPAPAHAPAAGDARDWEALAEVVGDEQLLAALLGSLAQGRGGSSAHAAPLLPGLGEGGDEDDDEELQAALEASLREPEPGHPGAQLQPMPPPPAPLVGGAGPDDPIDLTAMSQEAEVIVVD
jgi:AcrR family transcriptional regulator